MQPSLARSVTFITILIAGFLAGGQTTGVYHPSVNWAGTNSAYVTVTAPAFKDKQSKHVVFTDSWQHEEYVLFEGKGAQAEIIYVAANERDTIALDYNLTVVPMVDTWNIARKHPISWGEEGQIGAPLGAFFYRHFRLTNTGRDCVGFFTEWDLKGNDPQLRYGKALFGYYCEKPSVKLNRAQVFGLLDNIWIRGITARLNVRFHPVAPTGGPLAGQEGALAFAKHGNGVTGNTNFPFNFASYYNDVDGDDRRDR